jgi:hypothetical protein
MMAWYVFALIDAVPAGRAGSGLSGPLSLRKLPAGFAVVERRADVPPVEFGSLKQHQDVVARLAASVPAILPVRFGTLLEDEDFDETIEERDEEIADAFDLVRGRVQFTWRAKRRKTSAAATALGPPLKKAVPASGTAYLRQAARAANPPPPAAFRPLAAKLSRFTAADRYQPATAALPEAVYHLVDRTKADRYATAARAVIAASPRLSVTGPFPPFAFAPEIL